MVFSSSSNGNGVGENPPSASKMPSYANLQNAAEATPIDSDKKDGVKKIEGLKFWKEKEAVESIWNQMRISSPVCPTGMFVEDGLIVGLYREVSVKRNFNILSCLINC